jgi:UDPglucose 6-dehydrogenase
LLERGATVAAYDPVAIDQARRIFGETGGLSYAASPMAAVAGADALVVVTEWKEFRSPEFTEIRRQLRQPLLFDGRNLFDPAQVRAAGIEYFGIGRH